MFPRLYKFGSSLSRKKIRFQLLTVYILFGMIPIIIVGSYLLIDNYHRVMKQHYDLTDAYNIRAKGAILNVTLSINNLAANIFQDSRLQDILATRYSSASQMDDVCSSYTKMDDYSKNYTEISSIAIYCNNPTMTDYGHFKALTPEDRKTKWYQSASQNSTAHWMTWVYDDSQYKSHIVQLRYVLKIPVIKTGEFAVLVISVNNNNLNLEIGSDLIATFLSVNKDPIFFSKTSECLGEQMPVALDYHNNFLSYSGITNFNGQKNLLQATCLSTINSEDKIYIVTVDYDALPRMKSIFLNCLLIVLFSLFIPLVAILYFSKVFSDRVITLKREMHKAGTGNYNIIETFNGSDELMDLFVELKTMIKNIKNRDREIYQSKIVKQQLINRQQEMEFKMLSSQINPHFLYNTLESIRMKAYLNGDTQVAYAVKLLGKLMRHVLESGSTVCSLQSELSYIQNYLEIMKVRFKDKINYQFSGTDKIDCEQYKMLPLLLQPIVENSVLHGLEEKESGGLIRIQIDPDEKEEKLLISISDNGCGMTNEQLQMLLTTINDSQDLVSHKIGLRNVQKRLKMFYGENYGMNIKSSPGVGTMVIISLPLQGKGGNDASPDC